MNRAEARIRKYQNTITQIGSLGMINSISGTRFCLYDEASEERRFALKIGRKNKKRKK